MTRDSAPKDSRAAWAEEALKNKPMQAAPGISTFAADERAWKTIDSLKAVAAETGIR